MRRLIWAFVVLLFCGANPVQASADLRTGFNGYSDLLALSAGEQRVLLTRMHEAGAVYVRIPASWSDIERSEPPPASASNPLWAGYDWAYVDRAVKSSAAVGLRPLIVAGHAPRWAEEPNRPPPEVRLEAAGSWRPSPARYRAFAKALAARYSGRTRLPSGEVLPRVRHYQAWNEPNVWLTPQFALRGGRFDAEAPSRYRKLLNVFYAGVKSVDRRTVVVAAATSPYGDYPATHTWSRNPPVFFIRRLLCLTPRGRVQKRHCPQPPRFDVLAFNAYPATPFGNAAQRGDTYIDDAPRLIRLLRRAERAGTALPRHRHPVWLTEFCWETREGDPNRGVSDATQARYLTQALYAAWRRRIAVAFWWQPRDFPPTAFFPKCGLFIRGPTVQADRPKPAFASYAFPFLAVQDHGQTRLWGLAPRRGMHVRVQRRSGGRWRTLVRLRARGRVFTTTRVRIHRGWRLRAVTNQRTSPSWLVR